MRACMPTSVSDQLVVELTAAAPINRIQSCSVHSMEQSYVMSRRVGDEKRRHEDIVIVQFTTVYLPQIPWYFSLFLLALEDLNSLRVLLTPFLLSILN